MRRLPPRRGRRARSKWIFGGARGRILRLRLTSITIGWDVRFLRQATLLLPSAFLLVVLAFLLTHGRKDPGFGTYPFFQEWVGEGVETAAPETRFLAQALVFFAPAYVAALFSILSVALAERAVFGRASARSSAFGRAFGSSFPVLYLISSVLVLWWGERIALRQAPGTLVAPVLAALAPFAAGPLAVIPAAVVAGPLALFAKASPA